MADITEEQLSTFTKSFREMVQKNENSWKSLWYQKDHAIKDYTPEEIEEIVHSSYLPSQQRLSRNYFDKNGIYKRVIMHYATLLTYAGLLIPHPGFGKQLSEKHIQKRYFNAQFYLDSIPLRDTFIRMALHTLITGSYYGVIQKLDKKNFILFDLPYQYCTSRFTDYRGRDIVEFNVQYFDRISDAQERKDALSSFPKTISRYYDRYKKGKEKSQWVKLPTTEGISFTFFDDGRPLFLDAILDLIEYNESKEITKAREIEEIRKILIQHIPHLADGSLLFEPPEAEVMHEGAVGMMKNNPNISVLTSYGDVEVAGSKTSEDSTVKWPDKTKEAIYTDMGVSPLLFAPTTSQALKFSVQNDISLMMILANKFSMFITDILNFLFGNSNLTFSYKIMPISQYNTEEFITNTMKLGQTGYSFLIPALASGLSQGELAAIKELENEVLDLDEVLIPLSSSYTQSSKSNSKGGAPQKDPLDKAQQTIKNEQSLENQGGSNA